MKREPFIYPYDIKECILYAVQDIVFYACQDDQRVTYRTGNCRAMYMIAVDKNGFVFIYTAVS